MHISKTFLVKPGLTEWKPDREDWKTEFSIEFIQSLICIFNMLYLKSTNIGLYKLFEEKI